MTRGVAARNDRHGVPTRARHLRRGAGGRLRRRAVLAGRAVCSPSPICISKKGRASPRRGMLLPPYDTAATLARLAKLIAHYAPRIVVALGDSFHDGGGPARLAPPDRATLAELQRGRDWIWIAGNHDPDPSHEIGGTFAQTLAIGPLTFRHEPTGAAGEIAGHLHPSARINWRGRSVVRRCFAADAKLRGDAGVRRLYRRTVDPRSRLRRGFRRARIHRACAGRAARLHVFVGALPVTTRAINPGETRPTRTSRSSAQTSRSRAHRTRRAVCADVATNCSNPTLTISNAELARPTKAPSANSFRSTS